MEDLIAFLDGQTEAVTEYSEPLARRLIEKITGYDAGIPAVLFFEDCGLFLCTHIGKKIKICRCARLAQRR